jgi:hypothetical protein
MAKKKTTKTETKEIVIKATLTAARIVEPSLSGNYDDIDVPEFLKTEGAFEKEAPVGFTPLISFGETPDAWKPGSWIIVKYLGTRESIGPNASAMYDFEFTPDGKVFSPASLWGSTIFDNKFKLLTPRLGQWIFIQYLGTTETSRKQNPAKDFRLAIVAENIIQQMGYSGK